MVSKESDLPSQIYICGDSGVWRFSGNKKIKCNNFDIVLLMQILIENKIWCPDTVVGDVYVHRAVEGGNLYCGKLTADWVSIL
jgi:hypothetical protein